VVGGLWQAEMNGAVFPASRLRRIERAQDALTHTEESVYDFLWGRKTSDRDEYRLTQAGYDRISKGARITKRNAALIVDRLVDKGFVRIENPPDPLHRIPAEYRVLGYRAALDEMKRRGREWVVRTGNGVLFVHPVTVVASPSTTVVGDKTTTVVAATTDTVVPSQPTTVVAATTHLDKKTKTLSQSSSDVVAVSQILGKHITIDDDAVHQLIEFCREIDPKATTEEIGHFALTVLLQNIQNPNVKNLRGLVITSTKKFFLPGSRELEKFRSRKIQERDEHRRLLEQLLDDPNSSPGDRQWALNELSRKGS
jgi:hypothetical protein